MQKKGDYALNVFSGQEGVKLFVMEMRKEFQIAFDMANSVNNLLSQKRTCQEDFFVSLDDILESVKKLSQMDNSITPVSSIDIIRRSFQSFPDQASKYGAMLGTQSVGNARRATIIVNTDFPAVMQRFSTAHEIGHLITESPNFEFKYETPDDNRFTVSTHIHPDITLVSEDALESSNMSDYMIAEQRANIFALIVLIPQSIKISDLKDNGAEILAKKYGVTEDAIYSRMLLSNLSNTSRHSEVGR